MRFAPEADHGANAGECGKREMVLESAADAAFLAPQQV